MKRNLIGLSLLALCACVCEARMIWTEDKKEVRYDSDLKPTEEILQEVEKTRQALLDKAAGKPEPKKPKDPRQKIYLGFNLSVLASPKIGLGYGMGVEGGYNFVVQKNNSLRFFVFFDRFSNSYSDFNFNPNARNAFQIYRFGISAEYRAYVNPYFGFRARLFSFGVRDFALNSDTLIPTTTRAKKSGILPTIAFGPIFNYKQHELFLGYDLIDYTFENGPSVNFLQYSLKF
ncbi:hypothetical protein ACRE1S_05900 [Helicobacter himalayensis]|uniref:hypothetical protein n=1 Tax=Helicobacter himalayensis TaxID=1591088 RepID=UPI003D6E29E5